MALGIRSGRRGGKPKPTPVYPAPASKPQPLLPAISTVAQAASSAIESQQSSENAPPVGPPLATTTLPTKTESAPPPAPPATKLPIPGTFALPGTREARQYGARFPRAAQPEDQLQLYGQYGMPSGSYGGFPEQTLIDIIVDRLTRS